MSESKFLHILVCWCKAHMNTTANISRKLIATVMIATNTMNLPCTKYYSTIFILISDFNLCNQPMRYILCISKESNSLIECSWPKRILDIGHIIAAATTKGFMLHFTEILPDISLSS